MNVKISGLILIAALLTVFFPCLAACASTAGPTNQTPALSSAATSGGGSRTITPEAARELLAGDNQAVLLDVRTADEYAAGRISGSQLLPYDEILKRQSELPADKNTPIIVYCRTGRRSALAAATLIELAYTAVYDLGGIQDWPYETEAG